MLPLLLGFCERTQDNHNHMDSKSFLLPTQQHQRNDLPRKFVANAKNKNHATPNHWNRSFLQLEKWNGKWITLKVRKHSLYHTLSTHSKIWCNSNRNKPIQMPVVLINFVILIVSLFFSTISLFSFFRSWSQSHRTHYGKRSDNKKQSKKSQWRGKKSVVHIKTNKLARQNKEAFE